MIRALTSSDIEVLVTYSENQARVQHSFFCIFLRTVQSLIHSYGLILVCLFGHLLVTAETPADKDFHKNVRVYIRAHCSSCHNSAESKGGVNLDVYDFAFNVARRGQLFQKVVKAVEDKTMPPNNRTRMTQAERDTMVAGINRILDKALAKKDPGPQIMRRLSHREYGYTVKDLLGVDFDALAYFPSEASGGEGFDNQSRVLYMTPLLWERYYEAADSIMRQVRADDDLWSGLVPKSYQPSVFRRIGNWWKGRGDNPIELWSKPAIRARETILPLAWKTYRRFLDPQEEEELLTFFATVYTENWQKKNAFDDALAVVFKRMLVSPKFLFRMEANLPTNTPYEVNNLELASRLSYFLWSSMPDAQLYEAAYRENLHDSTVLRREAQRMISDPKFKRFSESFVPQWLGVQDLVRNHQADPNKFPEFTSSLKEALSQEVIEYFNYVFKQGDLLKLIDSDFSLINEELAQHYQVPNVVGSEMRVVHFTEQPRGGILGMGAVLAATSLPTRTSPVLRGQWVLENLLGTRIPPPPPDVPDLVEARGHVKDEFDLRGLLEFHREPSECQGCHQKMDPIGFGLENFDAIGRWRDGYREGTVAIDASGIWGADQIAFDGPLELRSILLQDKDKFAENLTRKMLSYALGRGLLFLDTHTINNLKNQMIKSNFKGEDFLIGLVNSYPFRYRRSDQVDQYKDNVL